MNTKDKFKGYSTLSIRKAIESLGVESLCGVSEIDSLEVYDFMESMEDYEIEEIYNLVKREKEHNKLMQGQTNFYN
jgi:hypothetical protein